MNLKMQAGITWSRPGNYCENYCFVFLGLYDQFMTQNKSESFEPEKSAVEEKEILENAVPRSIRSVNKWAMAIFGEWQAGRTNKKPVRKNAGLLWNLIKFKIWKRTFVT